MKLSSPTSLLLNLGHAMDHWVIAIFLYTVSVIAGVWGADWKELTPYAFGASFMFGAGSIVSGKLGDQWGRREPAWANEPPSTRHWRPRRSWTRSRWRTLIPSPTSTPPLIRWPCRASRGWTTTA